MDLATILTRSLWAGLFSGGMGTLFTAPPRHLASAFLCGAAGHFARDAFVAIGLTQAWATVVGAAVVVLVAAAVVRGREVSPVVLVSAVLSLGAAMAMFRVILGLLKIPSLEGESLDLATVELAANSGKVFTITLAIASGLAVGLAVTGAFGQWRAVERG